MAFRNLSQKYRIISSQKGVALFTAMMLLVLVSGLSLFMLYNATTQMQIASESGKGFVQTSLAESGIEQALAWYNDPLNSPNLSFFSNKVCKGNKKKPWEQFSFFIKDIGEEVLFLFYKSDRGCVVEAIVNSGKKVTVTLAENPLPPLPYAVYGLDVGSPLFPDFVHGGMIHSLDVDPEQETRMNAIKRFSKRFGRYFMISPHGTLEENGADIGTFETVFANKEEGHDTPVFIDTLESYSSLNPLKIGNGDYKGYYYFFGDVEIEGGGNGQTVLTDAGTKLNQIDLAGFIYTKGRIILNDRFFVYGALYAGLGVEGNGVSQLEVWYNKNFQDGIYKGVLPLIPLVGTRMTM
jgi:hypothetical protein